MRIAIMGSGGVGGYFGARLAASGCEVHFIARGEHLEAMRARGLRVESPRGDLALHPVLATDDPASIGPVDVVFIAVKLWSTEEAVRAVVPLLGPETAAVSFQNGVEALDLMEPVLGAAHVLGGVAHIAALIESPGVIRHNGTMHKLSFGELDGRRTPRVEALLGACTEAGIDAAVSEDIRKAIWEKFVFLAGLSGMTTLTRLPIGPIREDPLTREMLAGVMEEVVAVGRAKGVALDPDTAGRQLTFTDGLPADMVASMLGDLRRGRRLELPWLAGAVVRLGEALGVPTPVNRFVYGALKLHAGGA